MIVYYLFTLLSFLLVFGVLYIEQEDNITLQLKKELGGEPSKLDVFIRSREGKKKKGTSKPLDETTSKMLVS